VSKSLIKILDYSLFPASILVISKAIGVLIFSSVLDQTFSIREYFSNIVNNSNTLPSNIVEQVSSYSDLLMFASIATFFTIVILRSIFLHDTHVKPTLVANLAQKNLISLIKSSYEIYHMGAVAILFTWISVLSIWLNILNDLTYLWVGLSVTIAAIILTTLLIQDVYKEIENIRTKPGSYDWI